MSINRSYQGRRYSGLFKLYVIVYHRMCMYSNDKKNCRIFKAWFLDSDDDTVIYTHKLSAIPESISIRTIACCTGKNEIERRDMMNEREQYPKLNECQIIFGLRQRFGITHCSGDGWKKKSWTTVECVLIYQCKLKIGIVIARLSLYSQNEIRNVNWILLSWKA